jgi:hypothetical protein
MNTERSRPPMTLAKWGIKAPCALLSLSLGVAAVCGATYSAATTAFPAVEKGNYLLAIGIMLGYFGMLNGVPPMAAWVNSKLVTGLTWLVGKELEVTSIKTIYGLTGKRVTALVVVLVALVGVVGFLVHGIALQRDNEAVAYDNAVNGAESKIRTEFASWQAVSEEDGVAIDWHGKTSELLWIDFRPAWKTSVGLEGPATWTVWARTSKGRYFKVKYWLNHDLRFSSERTPVIATPGELTKALVNAERSDLIDKFGLPRKPA